MKFRLYDGRTLVLFLGLFSAAWLVSVSQIVRGDEVATGEGSASNSAPAKATLHDTFDRRKTNRAHFYFVEKINGKRVKNARSTTDRSNGFGPPTDALGFSRDLLPETATLTLTASVEQSLLVRELNHVTGVVDFRPEAGQSYLVKGQIDGEYSAVWIEDINGQVVSALVEKYAKDYPHLEQARARILDSSNDRQSDSPVALFAQIVGGESEDLVRERFGAPDEIEEIPGNIFAERPRRTKFTYNNLGTVLFSQQKKAGLFRKQAEGLFVERVTPILAGPGSEDADIFEPITARHLIATDNSTTLRQIAQNYHKSGVSDPELLDLLAARLAKDYRTDNVMLLDALAWFCNTLGASNNGRYTPLLLHVSENGARKKLRRYARKAAKGLPPAAEETFPFN